MSRDLQGAETTMTSTTSMTRRGGERVLSAAGAVRASAAQRKQVPSLSAFSAKKCVRTSTWGRVVRGENEVTRGPRAFRDDVRHAENMTSYCTL